MIASRSWKELQVVDVIPPRFQIYTAYYGSDVKGQKEGEASSKNYSAENEKVWVLA